jgi:hypothetical protein
MSTLTKITDERIPDLMMSLKLDHATKEGVKNKITMSSLIDYFMKQSQLNNAMACFAWGLPSLEAIWWCLLSLQDEYQTEDDDIRAATLLRQISTWVRDPVDDYKMLISQSLDEDKTVSPATWLGRAVIWHEGNIAEASDQRVTPDENMAILAIHNAMLTALESCKDQTAFCKQAVERGLHIAMGGNGQL